MNAISELTTLDQDHSNLNKITIIARNIFPTYNLRQMEDLFVMLEHYSKEILTTSHPISMVTRLILSSTVLAIV